MIKRYPALLTAVALVAVPGVAAGVPLSQTPRIPSTSGGPPPAAGFGRKPIHIIYTGDGSALIAGRSRVSSHLHWSSWTKTQGTAKGADWHDNCLPSCAAGTYHGYRANIRVYRPRRLGKYLLFTRMKVTYTGARPPYPAYRHPSITFKLDYSAHDDTYFWAGG